jgi:3-hydroxymyristoyl/3-hydroxydecanoyl-(acyl carrier protein) dehydratase
MKVRTPAALVTLGSAVGTGTFAVQPVLGGVAIVILALAALVLAFRVPAH